MTAKINKYILGGIGVEIEASLCFYFLPNLVREGF
jgi:hypothetical protein